MHLSIAEAESLIKEQQERLDAAVLPWQRDLRSGDHAAMFYVAGPFDRFFIFYEFIEPDPEEPPLPDGYRLARGYSVVEPEGEYGLVHVAQLDAPLSAVEFLAMRDLGWNVATHWPEPGYRSRPRT